MDLATQLQKSAEAIVMITQAGKLTHCLPFWFIADH